MRLNLMGYALLMITGLLLVPGAGTSTASDRGPPGSASSPSTAWATHGRPHQFNRSRLDREQLSTSPLRPRVFSPVRSNWC
jgi:hypothetical protein